MASLKAAFPLVLLMAACSATPPAAETTTPVPAQAAATTTLKVGQVLEIVQQGNASTGYTWEFVQSGAPVMQLVELPGSGKVPVDGDKTPMVGAPSAYRWHYRAAEPGEAALRMVYRRPWEKDTPPAQTVEYRVVVTP